MAGRFRTLVGSGGLVGRHDANVGQIAIALSVVHAVADDEQVGDGEADVVSVDFLDAAGRLIEQRRNAERLWVLLREELSEIGKGQAGVENVLNDEDIFALDVAGRDP